MNIVNCFREVKDNRERYGKRYPLGAVLCLILLSRLCGYTNLKGARELAIHLHYKQLRQLGFRKFLRPSYQTIRDAVCAVEVISLEKVLSKMVKFDLKDIPNEPTDLELSAGENIESP